jgi:hypothetical protein
LFTIVMLHGVWSSFDRHGREIDLPGSYLSTIRTSTVAHFVEFHEMLSFWLADSATGGETAAACVKLLRATFDGTLRERQETYGGMGLTTDRVRRSKTGGYSTVPEYV